MKKSNVISNGENSATSSDFSLNEYLGKISKYPTLSADEEKSLAQMIKDGSDEAKKVLTQCNLKLVVTIARKMLHTGGLSLNDLIQEGNIGLMTAIDKYNYKLGYRFSTYATWWIKQAMFKTISEQSHSMKIPVYVQETLSKYSKVKAEMEKNGESNVSTEKIAQTMNIEPEKINLYLNAFTKSLSLDSEVTGDNNDMSLSEIIEDTKASANQTAEYNNLTKDINTLLDTLKDRESKVIKMRFGLCDEEKQTLEEIGNKFGVTKECIRQTESRALKKLRNNDLTELLYTSYVN
ncbi:MAG: RNA polymerase sigma factor RpoD/SigA [Candidatus Gastranaerophilaceae bacterium]